MKDKVLERVKRVQNYLAENDYDAFVVIDNEGMNFEGLYYLTGFLGTAGVAIIYQDDAILITDGRYIEQAKNQSPLEVRLLVHEEYDEFGIIQDEFEKHSVQSVICEDSKMYHSDWDRLVELTDEIADGTVFMQELRRTKDEVEISYIRHAGQIATEAFMDTLSIVTPEMTEKQFEANLNFRINMLGGETGFEMIVASGERSALPHGRATDKRLGKGQIVTVDFSAKYKGYFCDITRNFSIGKPEELVLERHNIVAEAHKTGAEALRAGIISSTPHRIACEVFAKYGLEQYFVHSLGHSFGLEVHERPFLSPILESTLKVGDIVTIEPGLYFRDWGGMRLEDDYLITENGAERLTSELAQRLFII